MASTASHVPDFDAFVCLTDLPSLSEVTEVHRNSTLSPSLIVDDLVDLASDGSAPFFASAFSTPVPFDNSSFPQNGSSASSHPIDFSPRPFSDSSLTEAARHIDQLEQQFARAQTHMDLEAAASDTGANPAICKTLSPIGLPMSTTLENTAATALDFAIPDPPSETSNVTLSESTSPHDSVSREFSSSHILDIDTTAVAPFAYNPHDSALFSCSPRPVYEVEGLSKSTPVVVRGPPKSLASTSDASLHALRNASCGPLACQSADLAQGPVCSNDATLSNCAPSHPQFLKLSASVPVKKENSGVSSAVESCRKAAEDFANAQVVERKRKAGNNIANDDDDDVGSQRKKKKKTGQDSPSLDDLSETGHGEDVEADEERPEDVSHRKYQKRLQKNRNSAFVSRIRRREYTRILEEALAAKEQEAEKTASAYSKILHEYEVVVAELNALRQTAKHHVVEFGRAIVRPVGEVASTAANHSASSTAVVTMFMFAIMFGILLPDLRNSTNYSGSRYGRSSHEQHGAVASSRSLLRDSSASSHTRPLLRAPNTCLTSNVGFAGGISLTSDVKSEVDLLKDEARSRSSNKLEDLSESVDINAAFDSKKERSISSSREVNVNDHSLGTDSGMSASVHATQDEKRELIFIKSEPIDEMIESASDGNSDEYSSQNGLSRADSPQHCEALVSRSSSGIDIGSPLSSGTCNTAAIFDDHPMGESSETVMMGVDGDLIADGPPRSSSELLAEIQKNATQLLGERSAGAVMTLVERKMLDGVVSVQSLALIADKSALALKSSLLKLSSADPSLEIVNPSSRGGGNPTPTQKSAHADEETLGRRAGDAAAVRDDKAVPLAKEGSDISQQVCMFLQRVQHVADEHFVAEVIALITYNFIRAESSLKRAP